MGARRRPESPRDGTGTMAHGAELSGYFNDKPLATPATRKMARDLNVDLKRVPPTGPQGRVTKQDVLHFSQGAPTPRPEMIGHVRGGSAPFASPRPRPSPAPGPPGQITAPAAH